jgi:hypothetical protein
MERANLALTFRVRKSADLDSADPKPARSFELVSFGTIWGERVRTRARVEQARLHDDFTPARPPAVGGGRGSAGTNIASTSAEVAEGGSASSATSVECS